MALAQGLRELGRGLGGAYLHAVARRGADGLEAQRPGGPHARAGGAYVLHAVFARGGLKHGEGRLRKAGAVRVDEEDAAYLQGLELVVKPGQELRHVLLVPFLKAAVHGQALNVVRELVLKRAHKLASALLGRGVRVLPAE